MNDVPRMALPELISIPLASIDWHDTSFSLLPEALAVVHTISAMPTAFSFLDKPPLVQRRRSTHRILYGWNRLHAQQAITGKNHESCTCFVVKEDVDDAALWEIILRERCLSTPLSPVECAVFLKKIRAIVSKKTICERFLPLIAKKRARIQTTSLDFVLELPFLVQKALHFQKISEATARLLALEEKDIAASLVQIIATLKLGGNKQKKFVEGCKEISLRDNVSMKDVLQEIDETGILSDQQPNPPQQAARLMNWLSQRLQPRLQQAEKKWRHFVSQLELPGPVSCSHSQSFERDEVTLSITCPSRQTAADLWQEIQAPVKKAIHR